MFQNTLFLSCSSINIKFPHTLETCTLIYDYLLTLVPWLILRHTHKTGKERFTLIYIEPVETIIVIVETTIIIKGNMLHGIPETS